jgi:hypothetical protein
MIQDERPSEEAPGVLGPANVVRRRLCRAFCTVVRWERLYLKMWPVHFTWHSLWSVGWNRFPAILGGQLPSEPAQLPTVRATFCFAAIYARSYPLRACGL